MSEGGFNYCSWQRVAGGGTGICATLSRQADGGSVVCQRLLRYCCVVAVVLLLGSCCSSFVEAFVWGFLVVDGDAVNVDV